MYKRFTLLNGNQAWFHTSLIQAVKTGEYTIIVTGGLEFMVRESIEVVMEAIRAQ